MIKYIKNSISNEQFKQDFFGEYTAWGTTFAEDPKLPGGAKWEGYALTGTIPQGFENPDYNNFISVSSISDPLLGRTLSNWNAMHMLLLDDVGKKVSPEKILLPPSCKIETSPGNYQYYYRLDTPCTDMDVAKTLLADIGGKGLCDPSGNNITRYARCPIGSNTKSDYGKPFKHKVVVYEPNRVYSIERIRESLGVADATKNTIEEKNYAPKMEGTAGKKKAVDKGRLQESLSRIDQDQYENWRTVGMGLYYEYGGSDDGFKIWDEWSAKSPKYKQEEMKGKWQSFDESTLPNQSKPITGASIIALGRAALTYEYITAQIADTSDGLKLATSIADMVTDSSLKESQKTILRKAIATKSGSTIGSLKADAKVRVHELVEETQIELARQVVEAYGTGNLVHTQGRLYCWQGKGVWESIDSKEVKRVIHQISPEQQLSGNFVSSIMNLIETEIYLSDIIFDNDPEGINCPNGELHLVKGAWELRPHDRGRYSLTQIPVTYDPNAVAPRFTHFLDEIFEGDDDALQKTKLLLELMGYSLLASCAFEKFVILIGGGANGKSVLLSVLASLVGQKNVAAVAPDRLDNTHQRAFLRGKLLNLISEIPEGSLIDDASLKALVSGDLMTADEKYKSPVNFNPYSTCWFGTNHMPGTRDFSDALFRRACILKFNNRFEGDNCDPGLKAKLLKELPGILNMVLSAFGSVMLNGAFTEPPSMVRALQNWRLEADQVRQFVGECCELCAGEEPKSNMWNAYLRFADDFGIPPSRRLGRTKFNKRLLQLEVGERRDGDSRYYTGIALKSQQGVFQVGESLQSYASKL